MFAHLRLRSEASLEQLCEAFQDITLQQLVASLHATAMAHHRTQSDVHTYHSTASTPSLRSRQPTDTMERPYTPPDADAGNVKVVVRVRKFIRRGEIKAACATYTTLEADCVQRLRNSSHALWR